VRREDILRALGELASVLRERNVTGEIYIVGGAAIAVAYSSDRETDDVDAVFRPKEEVRAAALTGAPAEVRRTSAGTR
jgi:predicted nucleotidyltransferase